MYNEERKTAYLEFKKETATISNNLYSFWLLTETKEKELDRDIAEWTSDEILDFYRYFSTAHIQTLIVINNALVMYTDWCIGNGLVADNQNHFREITTDKMVRCVDTEKLKRTIVSREQLLAAIRELPNASDQFIFLGLFEGIPLADHLLADVELSDLDGNTLHLKNGDTRELSDELVTIMKRAAEEEFYISVTTGKEAQYVEGTNTLVRPIVRAQGTITNKTVMVGNRFRVCTKFMGMEYTMKNLAEFGRIHYIKEMTKKYNITAEQAAISRPYRDQHEAVFGKPQNAMSYWMTYGQIFSG